jgi:hypothetical protein
MRCCIAEGEPSKYDANDPGNLANDPEGSVSVIELNYKKGGKVELEVKTAGFTAFNGLKDDLNKEGVRIFGPGASVAQDLEPECVTYSEDGKWAYASLQVRQGGWWYACSRGQVQGAGLAAEGRGGGHQHAT